MQRKLVKPAKFAGLVAVQQRLLALQTRYDATASPSNRRYTKDDLNAHLHRLAAHDPLSLAA